MQPIEPAVGCPTHFLGDRPVAFLRSSVGERRAHAVRTLFDRRRPQRGPGSGPRRRWWPSQSLRWRISNRRSDEIGPELGNL